MSLLTRGGGHAAELIGEALAVGVASGGGVGQTHVLRRGAVGNGAELLVGGGTGGGVGGGAVGGAVCHGTCRRLSGGVGWFGRPEEALCEGNTNWVSGVRYQEKGSCA